MTMIPANRVFCFSHRPPKVEETSIAAMAFRDHIMLCDWSSATRSIRFQRAGRINLLGEASATIRALSQTRTR